MKRCKTLVEYVNHTEHINVQKKICVSVLTFRICLNKLPNWTGLLEFYEPLEKYLSKFDIEIENSPEFLTKTYVVFTTRGIAKCNDKDEFNEETGKHIALTRAQSKAFAKAEGFYKGLCNILYKNICIPLEMLSVNSFQAKCYEFLHAAQITNKEPIINTSDPCVKK